MMTTSLARRIALRSTGPHRNIPHAFRGHLRHLHETAQKPVFRWEVRIRFRQTPNVQFFGLDSKWKIEPPAILGPFGT